MEGWGEQHSRAACATLVLKFIVYCIHNYTTHTYTTLLQITKYVYINAPFLLMPLIQHLLRYGEKNAK